LDNNNSIQEKLNSNDSLLLKENLFQKIIRLIVKFELFIIAAIAGLIGILEMFITARFDSLFYHPSEYTNFFFSFGFLNILFSILLIGMIYLANKFIFKKVKPRYLIAAFLIPITFLFFYWINALRLNPEVDQKMIEEIAKSINGNWVDYYLQLPQYLFLYPYQLALAYFIAIVYKIFGENYLYIEYINAICSVINLVILYLISNSIFKSEKNQKTLSYLLLGFSLYWMFFNVHYYGNIIGLTPALLSVLFLLYFLESEKIRYVVLSSVLVTLSILIKTNYYIFFCGIILVLVLYAIKKWTPKVLVPISIFIATFIIVKGSYSIFVSNVLKIDLPKGTPMITYIYMGMDETEGVTPGWYNQDNYTLYEKNGFDYDKTVSYTKDLISQRTSFFVSHPGEFIKFYAIKFGSTWLNPTFQTVWTSLPGQRYNWYPEYNHYLGYHETLLSMVGGDLFKVEEFMFKSLQIIVFIFAAISIVFDSNKYDLKIIFPLVIFIGGLLFHLIWETKAIYVIQYYFLLLPFSANGINRCLEQLELLIKKQNEKASKN